MYAAEVEGHERRLNFVVSGMLWNRSLVMQDVETNSLWSHILGRAMDGDLKGSELEVVPSTITDWGSWKTRHAESTVTQYSRTARRFTKSFQEAHGKYVLGLEMGEEVKAYPYDVVAKEGVVNDVIGGRAVVITYDPAGACANAFSRNLPGAEDAESVEFTAVDDDKMRDNHGETIWDRQSGVGLNGAGKGLELSRLPGIPSYGRAWEQFHPTSKIFTGE